MKELSLNILDIAQNSVTAKSTLININLTETDEILVISISDNGCGMSKEMVERVSDPFCTTRKTRKVGLGIPFFRLAAEQTEGSFEITSTAISDNPENHGTTTKATFIKTHLDFTPLGDIISTICTLIQGCGDIDIVFTHDYDGQFEVKMDTREIKQVLGEDIPLSTPDVLVWVKEFLQEQYKNNI